MKSALRIVMLLTPLVMIASGLFYVAGVGWALLGTGVLWYGDIRLDDWKAAKKE